ncbi:hypothetical protein X798_00478 [Onchocerca flexuosa]|uniref:Uncharacterized protein n=1 Tax=Onchocerca flexuosa TaxID=387005 RepID=A0A238C688_9BILA|nr:hypothetical protein X798_00478 [Onchocerca flexuosa]
MIRKLLTAGSSFEMPNILESKSDSHFKIHSVSYCLFLFVSEIDLEIVHFKYKLNLLKESRILPCKY